MASRGDSGLREHDGEGAPTALLLIDLINDFDFEGGAALARQVAAIAPRIASLAVRLRRAGVPVIYCNDNFGRWRSDFREVVRRCAQNPAAADIVARLQPQPADYFVLKPRHSAFYATPLELLLKHLGSSRVVLAGAATDNCIACTAADAHMREFEVCVPRDCVAARSAARNHSVLAQLAGAFEVDTRTSARITVAWARAPARRSAVLRPRSTRGGAR